MRWDSPPVLVVVGTIAIHTLLLTTGDVIATLDAVAPEEAPHFDLFEIEEPPPTPDPPKPPPLPVTPPVVEDQPKAPVAPPTPVHTAVAAHVATHVAPFETPPDPAPVTPNAEPGGGPVVAMDDIAPSAHGVAVARGPVNHGHIGRGGSGDGTGGGSGAGAAEAPVPMSVATIKTRALPHGDYSYFGAGKDYPAEAKSLGIEGDIRVRLVVDARGKVSTVTALNQLGHGLDELADRYAHAIEFDAARDTDDKPVASVVVWTFHFTLPK